MFHKLLLTNIILFLSLFSYESARSEENFQESSLECNAATAKKIIFDAIPGENILAEKLLINCVRSDPKNLFPILELAKFIEQQVSTGQKPVSEIQKSIALISQAYYLAPDNPMVRYSMAHMLATMGEYEQAQALYEKTFEEFPNAKETFIEKAKLIANNDPKEAVSLIEKSVKMGTEIDDVFEVILSCIRYNSTLDNKYYSLAQLAAKFPNRWLFHKLGLINLDDKNYLEAAKSFNTAIRLGNKIESRLQLAILQYQYLKDYKSSVLNFKILLSEMNKSKYVLSSSLALVYSHYSIALFLNNEKAEASKIALQFAQKSFDKPDYIHSLVYEFRIRHALYILQPALEFLVVNNPTFEAGYAFLGELYKEIKHYAQAIDVLNKAIILSPKNDSFYASRGSAFYKSGDYMNALSNFNYALQLNPGTPAYLYNKACILARMGQKKESLIYLKMVLNSDKSFIDLAKNDIDFSILKSDAIFSKEFASLFFQNYDSKWTATDTNLNNIP